jgi:hypothetical protein
MSEASNEPNSKTEDRLQAVSVEQLKQIEGGDRNLETVSPVSVSGPLMDYYMHVVRGSNNPPIRE